MDIQKNTLVTRLLKDAIGKRVLLKVYDTEDIGFEISECVITEIDNEWAKVELYQKKEIRQKLIPVSSISSVTYVETEGKE